MRYSPEDQRYLHISNELNELNMINTPFGMNFTKFNIDIPRSSTTCILPLLLKSNESSLREGPLEMIPASKFFSVFTT